MTIARTEILEMVSKLPEQVDMEDIIYRLYLREKLAIAEAAVAEGQTLSPEEIRAQAESW